MPVTSEQRLQTEQVLVALGDEPGGGGVMGCQVVRGHGTDQFDLADPLEVLSNPEMPREPICLAQPPVCDLTDDSLHESVLASLGRSRVVLDLEQLLAHERG